MTVFRTFCFLKIRKKFLSLIFLKKKRLKKEVGDVYYVKMVTEVKYGVFRTDPSTIHRRENPQPPTYRQKWELTHNVTKMPDERVGS